MKAVLVTAAATAAVLAAAGSVSVLPSTAAVVAEAGQKVDNFQLTDQTRLAHELYYYKAAPAIVIMSRTNDSAFSKSAAADLERIAAQFADSGVKFFAINSANGETREGAQAAAAAEGLTVPILMDEYQLVGEDLGIQREGEVFVVNTKDWTVAYHGSTAGAAAAIEAVVNGRAVQTASTDVAGPSIAFPARDNAAQLASISYEHDVAPIIAEKCNSCHIEGGIGPFAMDSYEVVAGYAPMIRETIRTRRMPPYFPDPHIGNFQSDQGLTEDETTTLVHWIEAGTPRGAGGDPLLAYQDVVAPDWPTDLGEPDVIVDLPSFDVAASGIIEYQNFRVDNPFDENTWLRAIAIKPGDRRVLHHVISNHVRDRSRPATIPGGSVGSYTPGAQPQRMAEGAGAPVPGGGLLNFQMHYTTIGTEVTDSTQVGFYVMDEDPTYIKRSTVIGDFAMRIPAGDAYHQEVAYVTFPADAYLYTMYPHAHYRGKHVELKAIWPDGREEMLLSLPKYDFNWQRDYDPVEPIFIPEGTKLVAYWWYDNSAANFSNPDPTIDVTWGEQTHEEMMYFRINYRFADETVENQRDDLQAALSGSLTLGTLDDNVNGLVEPEELKGPMAAMRSQFASLDKDGNGGLDESEIGGINPMMMFGGGRGGRGGGVAGLSPAQLREAAEAAGFEIPDL